jgi:methyl-accepting chemotaxis protein
MKLSHKITLAGVLSVITTAICIIIALTVLARDSQVESLKEQMEGCLDQAKLVRDQYDQLHKNKAFDYPKLLEEAKSVAAGRSLKDVYLETVFYNTIPVVASWSSVKPIAERFNFKFLTPSHPNIPARNPKNNTGSDFKEVFNVFDKGEKSYFLDDKKNNRLIMATPIRLSSSCLICHGNPANSPSGNGLDLIGFKMENMKENDIKGAFVLIADMSSNASLQHTITTIIIVSLIVLSIIGACFARWLQKKVNLPLTEGTQNIQMIGEQVASSAKQVSSASTALATGSSEQAASLEETSASMEEVSSMVKTNSENTLSSKELSAQARIAVETGKAQIEQMTSTLRDIKGAVVEMKQAVSEMQEADNQVAKIVKNIDEIAFQTNILALNAAVEAARAGEAGMGFAVVADEVRNLAHRSAEAAKETSNKIESSIQKSHLNVQASTKVSDSINSLESKSRDVIASFETIIEKTISVDKVIDEIANASREQTSGVSQINNALGQMDKVVQSNASQAEETAAASQEMLSQAESLMETVKNILAVIEGGSNIVSPTRTMVSSSPSFPAPAPVKQRGPASMALPMSTPPKKANNSFASIPLPAPGRSKSEFKQSDSDFRDF